MTRSLSVPPSALRRALLGAAAAAAATPFIALPAWGQTTEISFGIISTESSANLKTAWAPVLEDLQQQSGVKLTAFFAPDYAGIIEAMRFNKVQVAMMGNKSAMEAVDRAQGEVFAKVVTADGAQGYWSLMIVHKDSPLRTLDDVLKAKQDLTLGFGDPNSTSGNLVPGYYAFTKNGVDPVKDFKRTVRANHETNILAVAGRQVDVATVASDVVDRMKAKSPEKAAELREVWRSPLIPSDPLVWRRDLDPTVKEKLRTAFLGYAGAGRPAREQEALKALTWSNFAASDNSQLVPIRQIELVRERTKLEADTAMPADEKARKLKDIEQRLNELGKQVAAGS